MSKNMLKLHPDISYPNPYYDLVQEEAIIYAY